MRPISTIAAFLLLLTVQATALAGITIEVPAEPVAVGQNVQVYIEGIAPDLLGKAITMHWPREGTTFVPARTWGGNPFIWFEATRPGRYLVSVTVPKLVDGEASLEHAEAVIVVGGEPNPNPTPPPVPPVPVPGEVSMVVILETGTRTADETEILGKLRAYLRTSKQKVRFADQDMIDGATNQTPTWLIPYLTAVTTRPVTLPVMVIAKTALAPTQPSSDTPHERTREAFLVVAVEELRDGDQAVALVKKYGGTP